MSKRMTLAEAIAEHVRDGDRVAMGVHLEALIPFAAGLELVRQGKKELTLIGPISDMLFDLLIGAGCVKRVIAAWVGNVSAGLGHNYRRAVEQGVPHPIVVEDHSNFTIQLALLAGAYGLPYVPARTVLGSDILRVSPALRTAPSPLDGKPTVIVPPLEPDVAILAVQRSDEEGNVHVWGNLGVAVEAGLASRKIIVLAEEVVPRDIIRSDPNRVLWPSWKVAAVVEVPGGCHPSPVPGYYNRDHDFFHQYHEESRTREGFLNWLERWVYGLPTREAYLEALGERWASLRARRSAPSVPVDYGY